MSKEAMRLALDALDRHQSILGLTNNKQDVEAIIALRKALAEQSAPAQQGPIDKNGSPCPEFWDWLSKAYNFEGIGNFTKYNMEVAFLAGRQNTSPRAQRTWVGLTNEERDAMIGVTDLSGTYYYDDLYAVILAAEGKLAEKNT